jgi:hypothetical protein
MPGSERPDPFSRPGEGIFKPAQPRPTPEGKPPPEGYGATDSVPAVSLGSTQINKTNFRRGVAMAHTFLLLSMFIPPALLVMKIIEIEDVQYFIGTFWANFAFIIVAAIFFVPMLHLSMRLHPWVFLFSVWIPAFIFIAVGWHYRDTTYDVMQALQSRDCVSFTEKRDLQIAYTKMQAMYNRKDCGKFVTNSVEQCPLYPEVFNADPKEMAYLKSLEKRFQCAGLCTSGRRLWDFAGAPAPACGLFAAQWIRGGLVEARFVLWYNIIIVLFSIPTFILLLDTFFKDFYMPLAK